MPATERESRSFNFLLLYMFLIVNDSYNVLLIETHIFLNASEIY